MPDKTNPRAQKFEKPKLKAAAPREYAVILNGKLLITAQATRLVAGDKARYATAKDYGVAGQRLNPKFIFNQKSSQNPKSKKET